MEFSECNILGSDSSTKYAQSFERSLGKPSDETNKLRTALLEILVESKMDQVDAMVHVTVCKILLSAPVPWIGDWGLGIDKIRGLGTRD